MEPLDSSPPLKDTPEKGLKPPSTGEPETWVKSFRILGIDKDIGEQFINQVQENSTSILEFSLQWEEYDKEIELRETSVKKQIEELKKRVRLFEERERKTEASITERLSILQQKEEEFDLTVFLEASVMRLFLHMQCGEVVDSMNFSMMKKHERQIRELEAKKEEIALLSKSFDEKSCDLEMKVKNFDLKQTEDTERNRKEAELMEIFLKQLEARENAIGEEASELEKKEENFQRDTDLKNKFLELKDREIEERSIQAKTRKRFRLESEHSLLEGNDRYAESIIRPSKTHKSIREHNHDDEDKKRDCVIGVPPSTSSYIQIREAREREIEEAVSTDGMDEDHKPLVCVDSEFNDFSKTISSFVVGQVWALYDSIDSMPRYYARIKKVSKSGSSFLVTWLEPKDKDPVHVSCGRFKWGITKTIKSHMSFSHVMHPIIYGKNYIAVIPKVGETWALFCDWSKSWNNNPEQHKPPYRFDFVEVVVDFDDCLGIGVAYLGKVEGFKSVYKQTDKHGVVSLMITPEEMPIFSHRVPSFKMNGEEKEGVPAGSFELDPVSISSSIPQRRHSIRKKVQKAERKSEDCGKTGEVEDQDGSSKYIPILLD